MGNSGRELYRFTFFSVARRFAKNLVADLALFDGQRFLLQVVHVHGRAGVRLDAVLDLEALFARYAHNSEERQFFSGAAVNGMRMAFAGTGRRYAVIHYGEGFR